MEAFRMSVEKHDLIHELPESKEAIHYLKEYECPGNVRELENIIGRAMINLGLNEDIIRKEHIPDISGENNEEAEVITKPDNYSLSNNSLKEIVKTTEKQVIQQALKETNGNRKKAADILGIAVRSLYYKMKQYDIN
jgi:transcriptional regulator with PAS, ATPase and Fis domain